MAAVDSSDAFKTIDAMWAGTIIQVGNFFKDSKGVGPRIKDVIQGTSVKYRDALDNLETEILDVKWILEHDLKQLRAKREATKQTAVAPTSAKRKLDATADIPPEGTGEETKNKRQKAEVTTSTTKVINDTSGGEAASAAHRSPNVQEKSRESQKEGNSLSSLEDPKDGQKPSRNEANPDAAMKSAQESKQNLKSKPREESGKNAVTNAGAGDAPLSAEPDINFESLGESPPKDVDTTNEFDANLNLSEDPSGGLDITADLDIGDGLNTSEILPGLESYAKAAGDDISMFLNEGIEAGDNSGPTDGNTLEMPQMEENEFDSLLRDSNFDQVPDAEQKNEDDLLNDNSLLNLDGEFDSWFN
ncbi:MAG: hypothetical protein Q9227_009263 [Pyrenula ochraceoflavens]